MKSLFETLKPRPSVFDQSRRDVVLDLTDLAEGKINPKEFFTENYITNGMKQLYESVFKRFEGTLDDGIFKLTQAMGGGKTHNMIAMGLLARYPEFRNEVMGKSYKTSFIGPAKVIAFSGRQQPDEGIWGNLAKQLGKEEQFKKFYIQGLKAPGQGDWIGLLQGDPTLIILDELPPYFQNAVTQQVGAGNLADVTTTALSNLLVAVGKKELSNVALIISDLSGSYDKGSSQMEQAFDNFEKETRRLARNFTPVQQNSDELYHILRKRIFENEANESDIKEIAEAYRDELDRVNKMDLTNESPTKLYSGILESYPFHPSIRELYARFKENPGFMQTRGLIILMRTVVANMYDDNKGWANKTSLIQPYDIDPNDSDTLIQLDGINSKLTNAISHDIADNGNSSAEKLSEELGNDLPKKTARLILMASLSNVVGATVGLKENELAAYLAEPGSDIKALKSSIIPELRTRSWYLHADNAGNFLFKNVQNISAKVNSYRKSYNKEAIKKEIVKILSDMFKTTLGDCYQAQYVLPAIDEINIVKDKVALIISEPHASGSLHPDLKKLYENERLKNRMMFLTGDHQQMESIYDQAKGIKATEAAINELIREKVPGNDPQMEEARTLLENYQFKFRSAVQNIFTKLYFPTKRGLSEAAIQLQFQGNNHNGEEQIRKTLIDKRKFNDDVGKEAFVKKIESKLFAGQQSLPWNDILQNAASMPDWDWHHARALEDVKSEQLRKDFWRENGNWIDKGPFPPPKTGVSIQLIYRDRNTGEAELRLKPIHGDTIHYDYGTGVNDGCAIHDHRDTFKTTDMVVSFLCVDSKGKHETGEAQIWKNEISLQHKLIPQGDDQVLEIQVAPANATIKYTTDGSNPENNGGTYEDPFIVNPNEFVQFIGIKDEFKSELKSIRIPNKQGAVQINKSNQLKWKRAIRRDNTSESFKLVEVLKKHAESVTGVTIGAEQGDIWMSLSTDQKSNYTPQKIEEFLSFLQDNAQKGSSLNLDIAEISFATGQQFLDIIKELKVEYKAEEIEQN